MRRRTNRKNTADAAGASHISETAITGNRHSQRKNIETGHSFQENSFSQDNDVQDGKSYTCIIKFGERSFCMQNYSFNENWEFSRGLSSAMAAGFTGQEVAKEVVRLPHDAMISADRSETAVTGAGGAFFEAGDCEYSKTLFWPEENAGKIAFLEFDGVYTNATVFINGDYVADWHNGYLNTQVRISDYLIAGQDNSIKVSVKNSAQPNGRWYTGEGIYRDVRLLIADPLYILPDGVKITTLAADEQVAVLEVETAVRWEGNGARTGSVTTAVYDSQNEKVKEEPVHFTVKSGETLNLHQRIYLKNPKLWSMDSPALYRCVSTVTVGDAAPDSSETTFGIRVLQLDSVHGLRINGKTVKLKGGCMHHDNGILGAVSFKDAELRRVAMMKAAGYNAIRGAHNPISKALLEACDELGVVVMEEFTDTWTQAKGTYSYGFFFPSVWEQDIEQMIRRDYNHPSIIMYSIGNEIPETGSRMAASWGRKIADKIRSLDSTRYITNGINIMMSVIDRIGIIMQDIGASLYKEGYSPAEINDLMNNTAAFMPRVVTHPIAEEATAESFEMLDIIGLNYAEDTAVQQHEKYPDRIYVGSETLPGNLDKNWKLVEQYDHIIGDFSWTAWDYLGEVGVGRVEELPENTPAGMASFMGGYPWIAAYAGDFDITGYRRPVSYWRETIWGGRENQPYIAVQNPAHIGKQMFRGNWAWTDSARSWNWPGAENQPIAVEVYSDAQEAELFVNGTSIGRKSVGEDKACYCKWETTYVPGEIRVVAYKDGEEVGCDTLRTPADDTAIVLKSNRSTIGTGENELAFIDIELRDADGTLRMGDDRKLTIQVGGPAELLAAGSGNPCTEESYQAAEHLTFEGRLLAVIRAGKESGTAKVTVTGEGIESASLEIAVAE